MRLLLSALLFIPLSSAFYTTLLNSVPKTCLFAEKAGLNKREFLKYAFGTVVSSSVFVGRGVNAAGLLEEYGSDFKNFDSKNVETVIDVVDASKKGEAGVDPTLRASYYYPTAKKRYLPRIKKVSDVISEIPVSIQEGDWDTISTFANKIADDAILPMKLYQSSLDGQGLHMVNNYAAVMKDNALIYEQKTKELQTAAKQKNKEAAVTALGGMSESLQGYRVAGRLTGPDGGGDIPSVEDMRRMAMRRPTTAVAKK